MAGATSVLRGCRMSSSEIDPQRVVPGHRREACEPVEGRAAEGERTHGSVHELHAASDTSQESTAGQLEQRMTRAMQIDTVGILFFRPDGRIIDCNEAFLRMSGVARQDVVAGRVRWDQLTPAEWLPASRRAVDEFQRTGRTYSFS